MVGQLGTSALQAIVYLAIAGIPSVLVTFGLAVALKLPEASIIRSLVGRFIK